MGKVEKVARALWNTHAKQMGFAANWDLVCEVEKKNYYEKAEAALDVACFECGKGVCGACGAIKDDTDDHSHSSRTVDSRLGSVSDSGSGHPGSNLGEREQC